MQRVQNFAFLSAEKSEQSREGLEKVSADCDDREEKEITTKESAD